MSYRGLREVYGLATIELYEQNESFYLHQVSLGGRSSSESFRIESDGLHVNHERLGRFVLEREDS